MKELTPEELEKTEKFAKACKDILDSERSEDEMLSFGVALEKRNISTQILRADKVNNQLDLIPQERSRRSGVSDSRNLGKVLHSHALRHKRHELKRRSHPQPENYNLDSHLELEPANVSDSDPGRDHSIRVVQQVKPTSKPTRTEKPTLFRNITKR